MNTFISTILLMLAALASARSYESYEHHAVSSGKGETSEMPLFKIDEFATAYKGEKGDGGEKDKKKKDDGKKKKDDDKKNKDDDKKKKDDDKKKKDDGGKKKHKSDGGGNKSGRSGRDSKSGDDKSSGRSSRSRSSKSSRSSSSSRSSRSSKSSSSSSSGDRRFYKRKNAWIDEDMCCGSKTHNEREFCDDLWEDLCRPGKEPDRDERDLCEYVGIYDEGCRDSRTSLRGNMVTE